MRPRKASYIYLISPVRNQTPEEKGLLDNYVRELEREGNKVHYPIRDVNQEDKIGLRILEEHKNAMRDCDYVHAYWNISSQGSFFDFGMAFMDEKLPWHIMNYETLEEEKFDNLDRIIAQNSLLGADASNFESDEINRTLIDLRSYIQDSEKIEYEFKGLNKRFLFEFGMAFFSEVPIVLKNRDYVESQRTPSKSFQNVLLKLDDLYRKG